MDSTPNPCSVLGVWSLEGRWNVQTGGVFHTAVENRKRCCCFFSTDEPETTDHLLVIHWNKHAQLDVFSIELILMPQHDARPTCRKTYLVSVATAKRLEGHISQTLHVG